MLAYFIKHFDTNLEADYETGDDSYHVTLYLLMVSLYATLDYGSVYWPHLHHCFSADTIAVNLRRLSLSSQK